jgi:hypothetical protein
VWELDGPTPMLNSSKTETGTTTSLRRPDGTAGPLGTGVPQARGRGGQRRFPWVGITIQSTT